MNQNHLNYTLQMNQLKKLKIESINNETINNQNLNRICEQLNNLELIKIKIDHDVNSLQAFRRLTKLKKLVIGDDLIRNANQVLIHGNLALQLTGCNKIEHLEINFVIDNDNFNYNLDDLNLILVKCSYLTVNKPFYLNHSSCLLQV